MNYVALCLRRHALQVRLASGHRGRCVSLRTVMRRHPRALRRRSVLLLLLLLLLSEGVCMWLVLLHLVFEVRKPRTLHHTRRAHARSCACSCRRADTQVAIVMPELRTRLHDVGTRARTLRTCSWTRCLRRGTGRLWRRSMGKLWAGRQGRRGRRTDARRSRVGLRTCRRVTRMRMRVQGGMLLGCCHGFEPRFMFDNHMRGASGWTALLLDDNVRRERV